MRKDINELINNNLKIMLCIGNNEIEINGEISCILSQETIAEIVHLTRPTVTNIIHRLTVLGFVEDKGIKHKKYALTQRGRTVVQTINKL